MQTEHRGNGWGWMSLGTMLQTHAALANALLMNPIINQWCCCNACAETRLQRHSKLTQPGLDGRVSVNISPPQHEQYKCVEESPSFVQSILQSKRTSGIYPTVLRRTHRHKGDEHQAQSDRAMPNMFKWYSLERRCPLDHIYLQE